MMGRPRRNKTPKVDVHVTLDAEVMENLISYCEDTGLSVSFVINYCLKDMMKNKKKEPLT